MSEMLDDKGETTETAGSRQEVAFHDSAVELAKQYTDAFTESLIRYSRAKANERGDELVLPSHVREGLEIVKEDRQKKRWKDLAIFVSSVVLGVSLQGYVQEFNHLTSNPSGGSVAATWVYLALTLVSTVAAMIAILR